MAISPYGAKYLKKTTEAHWMIRELRECRIDCEAIVTQKDVAEFLTQKLDRHDRPVTQEMVCNWELGRSPTPRVEIIEAWADYFGKKVSLI